MPNNELSQRDLLIRLSTQLEDFKSYTREKFEDLDRSISGVSKIKSQVARLDERVKENSKFRVWVYGSVITGLVSIVLAFVK